MDLVAYTQIDELEEIAKANGIEVPRLRGYRLMKNEETVDLEEVCKRIAGRCVRDLCVAEPFWNPNTNVSEYSSLTDLYLNWYSRRLYGNVFEPRWDRIHGRMRKTLKTLIHNEKKKYLKQYETFNKYAGREDILYIHARIGGGNWSCYHSFVDNQPWFIEKVDDAFDSTYCDIYAKIG